MARQRKEIFENSGNPLVKRNSTLYNKRKQGLRLVAGPEINCLEDCTMNKKELIDVAAKEAELSKKDVEKALTALTTAIVEEVAKKGKVQLIGFGTFEARQRASRKGKNPRTKKEIVIPAATVPAFKAGKAFKDAVNVKKVAKKAKKAKK